MVAISSVKGKAEWIGLGWIISWGQRNAVKASARGDRHLPLTRGARRFSATGARLGSAGPSSARRARRTSSASLCGKAPTHADSSACDASALSDAAGGRTRAARSTAAGGSALLRAAHASRAARILLATKKSPTQQDQSKRARSHHRSMMTEESQVVNSHLSLADAACSMRHAAGS